MFPQVYSLIEPTPGNKANTFLAFIAVTFGTSADSVIVNGETFSKGNLSSILSSSTGEIPEADKVVFEDLSESFIGVDPTNPVVKPGDILNIFAGVSDFAHSGLWVVNRVVNDHNLEIVSDLSFPVAVSNIDYSILAAQQSVWKNLVRDVRLQTSAWQQAIVFKELINRNKSSKIQNVIEALINSSYNAVTQGLSIKIISPNKLTDFSKDLTEYYKVGNSCKITGSGASNNKELLVESITTHELKFSSSYSGLSHEQYNNLLTHSVQKGNRVIIQSAKGGRFGNNLEISIVDTAPIELYLNSEKLKGGTGGIVETIINGEIIT